MAVTFLRWKFVDPFDTTDLNTYTFALNPNAMTSPYPRRNIVSKSTTAVNGRAILVEGQRTPSEWTFSGDFLEPNHLEALRAWVLDRTGRRLYLYDHFGRRMTVVPTAFETIPKRVIYRYWRHTYTITCLVLDITGATFRVDAPTAPRDVTAVGSYLQATITWRPSSSARGAAITHYDVKDTISGAVIRVPVGDPATATMGALSEGPHPFEVTAVSTAGSSVVGTATAQVLPIVGPSAPTITSVVTDYTSATVTWTPPTSTGGAPLVYYVVTAQFGTAPISAAHTVQVTANKRTAVIGGGANNKLASSAAYTFRVAAFNQAGKEGAPAAREATTLVGDYPGMPVITDANVTSASIQVLWDKPVRDGGAPISGYKLTLVTYAPDQSGTGDFTVGPDVGRYTFAGLNPGQTYVAYVYATNAANKTSSASSQNMRVATTLK